MSETLGDRFFSLSELTEDPSNNNKVFNVIVPSREDTKSESLMFHYIVQEMIFD